MKKQISMILSMVLIVIVAIFVLLNMSSAEINFGFTTVKMPLILVLLLTLLIGALIMFLLSMISSFKNGSQRKKENRNSQKVIDGLKDQVTDLNKQVDSLQMQLKNSISKQKVNQDNRNVEDVINKQQKDDEK
ncbi:lipopolysaccharide assembly protein LapA domain-containing protein [Fructilactobacillus fructivorans]|uniref:Putative integral membrane protein n=1 Tax=Fructilactobacillus fructivorans TaxID=1614 RepID=A0A0C1M4X6_9LACO|nr:lipopolysaccharide assembly protein LapA domain-containing protein [Fructilactobacillus fructivorans]KID41254.1 putative integral membrane protein [Fructilactobacillus fructivorans]KRN13684.1 hypothetical protein IV37_GL000408 [Fructilactobacillus fructivorans]MCT0152143.1 DUF1049 domain-containing protein [Fructilactobacillus fructivorans]MCT2867774.1 DUF1049 domain-containing protein [Fructilactobacillus fructivorans]MCT2868422.1 DUF1049 domain-containing protein [Fructilactobacillus fruc